jgi:TonB-dependent SusC/RagA subfamily outer membrane receptor
MIALSYYLLKVIICSGILSGYYWLALRNKIFHQYNRFYLLAAVVLSLLLPITKVHFWETGNTEKPGVIKVLQAVSEGDVYLDNIIVSNETNSWSTTDWGSAAYFIISLAMLLVLFHTLFIILRLLKKYPKQQIGNIAFVNTDAKSTPFSFLNYIFWNHNIDTNSPTGKQIFKHEVAHIQQKHTYDKLFINAVLAFFWCNPFFWLIRKELNMIHEFIADKKAVEDYDTAAFAAMILQATYPQHQFALTNNFFYSPIKRRLAMLVKNKNPKVNYWSRVLVLPLAVLVFAAFTFKTKQTTIIALNKATDNRQNSFSNQRILAILSDTTKKLKRQVLKTSINNNVCTIITDSFVLETNTKAPFGGEFKPLMIIDGAEFNYDKHQNIKITARIVKAHPKNDAASIKKYGAKAKDGVLEFYNAVVEIPETVLPKTIPDVTLNNALIVIDDKESGTGQVAIAGVDENDIDHMNIIKSEIAISKYGEKGKNGVLEIYTKSQKKLPDVLYVVDGEIKDKAFVNTIKPENIQSMDVLKGENATGLYGEEGKNGVIKITTKKINGKPEEVVVTGYPLKKAISKTGLIYIGVLNKIILPADKDKYDIMFNIANGSINGTDDYYTAKVSSPNGLLRITVLRKGSNQLLYNLIFKAAVVPDGTKEITDIKLDDYMKQEAIL